MQENLSAAYEDYVVSQGTLKAEDLVEAYLNFIAELKLQHLPPIITHARWEKDLENYKNDPTEEKYEELLHTLEEIQNHLNAIAPEGFYFGSHPGDGTLFAFWPIEE